MLDFLEKVYESNKYRLRIYNCDNWIPLKRNKSTEIFNPSSSGIILLINGIFSSPNVNCSIYLDKQKVIGTPKRLEETGLIGYNSSTFWLSEFDDLNKRYSVLYTPNPPMRFDDKTKIIISSPPDEDIMYIYSIVILEKVIK